MRDAQLDAGLRMLPRLTRSGHLCATVANSHHRSVNT